MQWHVNLPMTPWHDGFFERLGRSVKELQRKELKCYRLSYEELQTVLLEMECILIDPSRITIQLISSHALPQTICFMVQPLPI